VGLLRELGLMVGKTRSRQFEEELCEDRERDTVSPVFGLTVSRGLALNEGRGLVR
jgi:hypothetical protein